MALLNLVELRLLVTNYMNKKTITISLDAMGGDFGPDSVIPAAFEILETYDYVKLIVTGDESLLNNKINEYKQKYSIQDLSRIIVQHTTQVVGSNEAPSSALRSKKDSSMRVAINLVKEGSADASVSAGNTGALMATARFVLKMLPGIDRPAICSAIPTIKGHTHVLDLGANVETSPQGLYEFAVMGAALVSALDNKDHPTVGLLNIGEEEIKGNEIVKEAAKILGQSDINYSGYVEGDGIYMGDVDVVVCDGFVGNVMLKSSEGVARLFTHFLRQAFMCNIFTKVIGLLVKPVLKTLRKNIDPREYNGASLLGLQGIVIKSHGSADAYSFRRSIEVAIQEVKQNVPARITDTLEVQLLEKQAV